MTLSAEQYFNNESLPASVFDKYALRDKNDALLEQNPDQMHRRIARELARVERAKFKSPYSEDFIYGLLKDFGYIIPQGSPMYGIGNPQFITLSNCYVVEPPLDSYAAIHLTDEQMTAICKRRGGVGTDVSHIRPDNTPTTNAAKKSTGLVPFCERFSNTIREVAQKGRRGALMLTCDVHHPQILDFATMKLDPKAVTGANVSIRLSDEFMTAAVDSDGEYEQRWPVDSKSPRISRKVKAREVWTKIIYCAWMRAEPGLLFWDRILRESPADCYAKFGFRTISTNPCSELPLCVLDSCRLLLQNLFAYVIDAFKKSAKFCWKTFYDHAKIAQRLMDDIIDLELEAIDRIIAKVESDPEPKHVKVREIALWQTVRKKCVDGRRTGTGITALADTMAAIGISYGSDESIEFTDRLYRTLKFACYQSSVEMAEELGAFPAWDGELEKDCPFLNRFQNEEIEIEGKVISGKDLFKRMRKHGRRNIALLTTAPAGSVSILAGPRPYFGTSSGIEPLFSDAPYTRRKKIVATNSDVKPDFVDEMGDRWSHFEVFHPKLKMWMDVTGETDWKKSPYHGCTANDLDWKRRVKLQATAQKHVDHAISSTINLPNDVSQEKVAEIYEYAWKEGCKGITVYRDGCRDGVLVSATEKESDPATPRASAKRPKDLACDIHHTTVKKVPFVVVCGLMDGAPYEIFAFANKEEGLSRRQVKGVLSKVKRGHYELRSEDGTNLLPTHEGISCLLTDTEDALTRVTSTALRHGTDVSFLVHQLEKTRTGDLFGFSHAMARVLKKYLKDGTKISGEQCGSCGAEALIRQEGCCTCRECGWAKC